MITFVFNQKDMYGALMDLCLHENVAYLVYVPYTELKFTSGTLNVKGFRRDSHVLKSVGQIMFVTQHQHTLYCLFQTKHDYCSMPDTLELNEHTVTFFQEDMIQHCIRFLYKQPRENLFSNEDTLFQLFTEIQGLRIQHRINSAECQQEHE